MYWMPSSLIFSRTCFTSSLRPLALTCCSKSVMGFPLFVCWLCSSSRLGPPSSVSPNSLTPREGAVRGRMQFSLSEARETERPQQIAGGAADVIGDKMADADHL